MIDSDITAIMSEIIQNSSQTHHSSGQEYRILTSDPSQLSEDDLPNDLQSLSWLTSVDVPRLQQMASGRMDFSINSQNSVLHQTGQLVKAYEPELNLNQRSRDEGLCNSVMISLSHPAPSSDWQYLLGLYIGNIPGPMASNMQSTGNMIHVQANMQQDILGLNTLESHRGSMNQYTVGGQLSPSLQSQQPLYQAHSPQVYALSQATQQCSPASLYSTEYETQPQYSQPQLTSHIAQDLNLKSYPKPIYSYSCLIAMALKNSKTGSLPVSEIYSFMKEHFPYFKTAPDGWKNSVRHNLSLNKCFEKVENKMSGSSRKGCLWALNPAKIDKMEEEMQKWKRKDLQAIRRSMANPDELDKLITDRPETCRLPTKQADREGPTMTHMVTGQGRITVSQLQPQPIMTLSLHSIPLHHHIQTQAFMAPGSPAPAQTPPLHTLPDISPSPLQQHTMSRANTDFLNMTTDMSTEIDALDPSIMDFALQGNIWEEMKDDSFSLDTLAAFSNSPLQLSDCDLGTANLTPVSSGSDQSFSDLQVSGLYTTYATLDNVSSSQYLNAQGNKPIALL